MSRAIDLAQRANDDLAETVRGDPNRFGGFATLATQDPDAAAAEFGRAVTELGLVGGLINGHCQGRYLDDPAYEGLFGCAEDLGAPMYLHPTTPNPAVMEAWFAPYVADGLHLASWEFAAEKGTAVQAQKSGFNDCRRSTCAAVSTSQPAATSARRPSRTRVR